MDVSRLLAVFSDLESDYKAGLARLLPLLVQQYTVARDSPTVDNAPAILKAYTPLIQFIDEGRFSQYPPSKTTVLHAVGGDTRVGPGLKDRLNLLLSVQGQTTAGIVTALTALQTDIDSFRNSCVQARTGLEALGLSPHVVPPGEFEVGVLIPEALVDSKLSSLVKELGTWNKIVRGFQEVAGEEEREVTVVGLATGSYEVYLPLGVLAARYLSLTIDKILEWYLTILKIRTHRQGLKELEVPVAETSAVQKHEKDLIENGILALAKEIVKDAHPKIETNRRQELETHVTMSIRQITRFVNKGGTVEVDSTPPENPEEPVAVSEDATPEDKADYEHLVEEYKKLHVQFSKVAEILKSGHALRLLPARSELILQIEADPEDEGDPTEKQPKKKPEKSS